MGLREVGPRGAGWGLKPTLGVGRLWVPNPGFQPTQPTRATNQPTHHLKGRGGGLGRPAQTRCRYLLPSPVPKGHLLQHSCRIIHMHMRTRPKDVQPVCGVRMQHQPLHPHPPTPTTTQMVVIPIFQFQSQTSVKGRRLGPHTSSLAADYLAIGSLPLYYAGVGFLPLSTYRWSPLK